MRLGKIGMVARFKPVHNGHVTLLEAACDKAEHVVIGIGSSNKYDAKNPFTAEETAKMVNLALAKYDNYEIIFVPDLGHGARWVEQAKILFGKLDFFVTGNDYVDSLLGKVFTTIHPFEIIPKEKQVIQSATKVRERMATEQNWQELVPEKVAEYIFANGLDERYRKEFVVKATMLTRTP